ncbi:gas vesicle protein [Streptomyces kaniharaensis]|uniref:Gas vesicle protein n=1 Tax=Streptomyces kaniharaensis TaxID=212423 RepID=A0A6N7KYD7_9ACTN|nr:gas vesicle protein [Streptomyces kaniharaensis]MQS16642.1 gas vesicle protein [Streptomyces kaniharaensis]
MTGPNPSGPAPARPLYPYGGESGANLADILERVLDKGIVIVGDIKINLLEIELLTIKLRLLVASVDKAKEIGIDWWERDPALSSRADEYHAVERADERDALEEENERLRAEVKALRGRARKAETELPSASRPRQGAKREVDAAPRRRKRAAEREDPGS